jgi:hypothetical protein
MNVSLTRSLVAVVAAACVVPSAFASDAGELDKDKAAKAHASKAAYSPYAGRTYPTRPLFGDTHLHTGFSLDAGAFGARLTPKDAYRFARGEEVTSNSGQPVRLSRPLDFLVVADHSDGMGFFPQLMSGDAELLATPQGRKWYDQIRGGHRQLRQGPAAEGIPRSRYVGVPQRLDGDDQGRGGVQRSRPLHGVHRLRVDLEHRRQQPAPQHRLPR